MGPPCNDVLMVASPHIQGYAAASETMASSAQAPAAIRAVRLTTASRAPVPPDLAAMPGGRALSADMRVILAKPVWCPLINVGPPLHLPTFSLYDMCMVSEEQIHEEQIQKWADEAAAGYDVEQLKRRGRGRPGRGAEPMQVVAVRLTADELDALDAAAAKSDMSRSEAIRAALAHFAA